MLKDLQVQTFLHLVSSNKQEHKKLICNLLFLCLLTLHHFDSSGEEINADVIPNPPFVTAGNFKVKTQNIAYNSPINPVFYNYTGGTDVSVEHFTREFVLGVQPNFTIGGSLQEDRYQDCFLAKTSLLLSSDGQEFNDFIKQGDSPVVVLG